MGHLPTPMIRGRSCYDAEWVSMTIAAWLYGGYYRMGPSFAVTGVNLGAISQPVAGGKRTKAPSREPGDSCPVMARFSSL